MAGKGDRARPMKRKVFDNNFDQIDWVSLQNLNNTPQKEIRNYTVKKGKKIYKYP